MILKRYGPHLHSVAPNFDARAMNEVGFQKNEEFTQPCTEFDAQYECVNVHELTAEAEGDVQMNAEQSTLAQLLERLEALRGELNEGHYLVIENEAGKDYPKLREKVTNIIVNNENRLYFHRSIDPPLRLGVYAPRKS